MRVKIMKKKIKVFLVILIVGLVICGTGALIIYHKYKEKEENERIISEIKDSYSSFVITTQRKDIYIKRDNDYQKIGDINQNTILPLMEKEIVDKNDIYYQIDGTDYYIDYMFLIEKADFTEDVSLDKYLSTQTIHTTKTNLYQDGKLQIELNQELTFDVLLVADGKYYVKYLGGLYYIEDSYSIAKKELEVNVLEDISVLNFSDDISIAKLEEVLKYLRENDYDSITIDDFKLWISGNVELEAKKILLLSYQELDSEKQQLLSKYQYQVCTNLDNISFTSGDTKLKVGDTKYYKYEIYSTTSIDRVIDMLNGIKEKKIENQQITVLNYHFFYDSSIGESCNESICLDVSNFREQLDYLKNNGYKTLTMQEFNDWMDKKITLPEKSVLITIDDGAMGTSAINGNKLIPILEEYQMHATLFLITGWWNKENYQSEYLEIESHGNELHHNDYCNDNGCGYKGLKLSKEELVEDLKLSIERIGSNLAFCYPFYAKNETMVEALKETGFQLAFVGGNRKAKQTDNKYAVPRYVVYKNTSLNSFVSMVK